MWLTKKPGTFHSAARTDTGSIRDHNEDSITSEPELGLWLVADGMGGHQAGDVASQIARDIVQTRVTGGESLERSIVAAHAAILDEAGKRRDASGMGSTIVALQKKGFEYEIAWVGDSRAYLWDGRLRQLTRDDSYVQDLIQSGVITAEQARKHPSAHLLTKCMGAETQDAFGVSTLAGSFSRGQEILLCSDGLTDELTDGQIAEILAGDGSQQQRIDELVQASIEAGGRDNISAILVSAPKNAPRARVASGLWANLMYLALGAGVGGLLLLIAYLLKTI